MRQLLVATVATFAVWGFLASAEAAGQVPYRSQAPYRSPNFGRSTRAPYSAYLNLFRPGATFAQNYYGLVRPQMQFRSDIQSLEQQTSVNRYGISNLNAQMATGLLPPTGHPTSFMTHTRYFGTGGAGRGGGATGGQGGSAVARSGQGGGQFGQAASSRSSRGSGRTGTARTGARGARR